MIFRLHKGPVITYTNRASNANQVFVPESQEQYGIRDSGSGLNFERGLKLQMPDPQTLKPSR